MKYFDLDSVRRIAAWGFASVAIAGLTAAEAPPATDSDPSTPDEVRVEAPAPAEPPATTPEPAAPPTATESAPEAAETPARAIVQPDPSEGLRLNFRGAPLESVLNYLSEAGGFVIVLDAKVTGTVDVMSHQPLSQDEAVDLLNAILVDKGYVAVRNGRILKIVNRSEAPRSDLPVRSGSDPTQIPKRDEMVHQIIPVRYADALKLVENISGLLPEGSVITANESSNAILLTDTMTNIRRMAEIVRALDTSIANISTVKVYPLRYSDATELAEVVTELFKNEQSNTRSRGMREMIMQRFGGRGGGDGGGGGGSSDSEARAAASRVVAVADERSNSLVVSAPDEIMPTIDQLVREIDTNVSDLTEYRVFRLEYADAVETAEIITSLFAEDLYSQTSNRGGRGGFRPPFMQGRGGQTQTQQSQRMLDQARVVAVGDPRTNSLLVSAGKEAMVQIAEMIGRLDADSSKKQRVYVYSLEHADVDNVANILRGMFETTATGRSGGGTGRNTGGRTGQTTSSRLSDRMASGASIDPVFSGGTGSNNRTGGR